MLTKDLIQQTRKILSSPSFDHKDWLDVIKTITAADEIEARAICRMIALGSEEDLTNV